MNHLSSLAPVRPLPGRKSYSLAWKAPSYQNLFQVLLMRLSFRASPIPPAFVACYLAFKFILGLDSTSGVGKRVW